MAWKTIIFGGLARFATVLSNDISTPPLLPKHRGKQQIKYSIRL